MTFKPGVTVKILRNSVSACKPGDGRPFLQLRTGDTFVLGPDDQLTHSGTHLRYRVTDGLYNILPVRDLEILSYPCTCSLDTIMVVGCQCGGM